MQEVLSSYRCTCGKMLLRGFIFTGEVEIKCRACKKTNIITGINGNLSNNHRYVIVSEPNGKIVRATSSAQKFLGYTAKDLDSAYVHDIFGFKPTDYAYFVDNLEKAPTKAVVFKATEKAKDGKTATVQVGVRFIVAMTGSKILVFDIERDIPYTPKTLEMLIKRPRKAALKKTDKKS